MILNWKDIETIDRKISKKALRRVVETDVNSTIKILEELGLGLLIPVVRPDTVLQIQFFIQKEKLWRAVLWGGNELLP